MSRYSAASGAVNSTRAFVPKSPPPLSRSVASGSSGLPILSTWSVESKRPSTVAMMLSPASRVMRNTSMSPEMSITPCTLSPAAMTVSSSGSDHGASGCVDVTVTDEAPSANAPTKTKCGSANCTVNSIAFAGSSVSTTEKPRESVTATAWSWLSRLMAMLVPIGSSRTKTASCQKLASSTTCSSRPPSGSIGVTRKRSGDRPAMRSSTRGARSAAAATSAKLLSLNPPRPEMPRTSPIEETKAPPL